MSNYPNFRWIIYLYFYQTILILFSILFIKYSGVFNGLNRTLCYNPVPSEGKFYIPFWSSQLYSWSPFSLTDVNSWNQIKSNSRRIGFKLFRYFTQNSFSIDVCIFHLWLCAIFSFNGKSNGNYISFETVLFVGLDSSKIMKNRYTVIPVVK